MRRLTMTREHWTPQEYDEKLEGDNCVVYLHSDSFGRPVATGFIGKQSKPKLNTRYQTEERRSEHVKQWMGGIAEHEQWKRERKSERQSFDHTLEVGDILYSSWGYDQTNIDFYEVVRTTKKSVEIRKLAQTIEETGFMSGKTSPLAGQYTGEKMLKRVGPDNTVKIESYAWAWVWDGQPKYNSWYH
jgi:hypothetical protein